MSKRMRVGMKVISGIYEIVNLINGNRYVGSSKDIYGRWVQHQNELKRGKHCNSHLQSAWNLYHEENFEFRILEETPDTISDRFIREQYWYDFYKNSGIVLYNESEIAAYPGGKTTVDDLKNGKRRTTYSQFLKICELLQNTDFPFYKIADITGTYVNQVFQIYCKKYFSEITKDMKFKTRNNKGENCSSAILTESDVKDIIQKMINFEYTSDLAKEYNVSSATIDDIRHHKTWKELTFGITFPCPRKCGNKGKAILQYDMNGNFIAEYKNSREAGKNTGIGYKLISKVCLGQRKHTHGFVFMFKDNITIQN